MKLSPLTIYILGIAVAIVALAYGFREALPNWEEAEMLNQRADELENVARQMPQANDRVAAAEAQVEEKAAAWRRIVAVRTPPQGVNRGGVSLAVNGFQLSVDTRKFRNHVQRAVNNQLKKGGVRVVSGPYVPAPDPNAPANSLLASYYNYPAIPFPVVIFDLGQVVVQGTYRQINEHVRSYSRMPRYLALADGLRIEGTSPNLTGTYNLQIVGFIRGRDIYPPVPEGAAPAGGGGGGGMTAPGPGRGSYPGGPGGGMLPGAAGR